MEILFENELYYTINSSCANCSILKTNTNFSFSLLGMFLRTKWILLGIMTKMVTRSYQCDSCKIVHNIQLPQDLSTKHTQFPFAYFYLHGDAKDVLSTLYLDAELKVRGAETQKLDTGLDDIFSKGQMLSIVQNLMAELARWQNDYEKLKKKYDDLIGN